MEPEFRRIEELEGPAQLWVCTLCGAVVHESMKETHSGYHYGVQD